MKLLSNHSYYCSNVNFYSPDPPSWYLSWQSFYENFVSADLLGKPTNPLADWLDMDCNLLFRWDLEEELNDEDKSFNPKRYTLRLFFMQQRKGKFMSVRVDVEEKDEPEIEKFLLKRWDHMKSLWEPLSLEKK
jgi:hypothetical protein